MMADELVRIGSLEFDPERRTLSGPRGRLALTPSMFALLDRLAKRPETIVPHDHIVAAVWPDVEDEPEHSMSRVRKLVSHLRLGMLLLGCDSVVVVAEPGLGYVMRARDRG